MIPFKTLNITNTDLNLIDFRAECDFVLQLEQGQRIVTFKHDGIEEATLIGCIDRLGRVLGCEKLEHSVERESVAQWGPHQFVVYNDCESTKLSVYNSSLHRVRSFDCKSFMYICKKSKFVFGLLDSCDSYETDSKDDDHEDDYNDEHDEQEEEEEEENSTEIIQVTSATTRKFFLAERHVRLDLGSAVSA